jgi:HEPN domain-containing protein
MTQSLKNFVEAWLQKAESDLMSAQRLLEIAPMILDTASFHCQQAAEKSLKAFLCYKGVDIEKTHDIYFLLSQCSNFDSVFDTVNPLNINVYAVRGRYPDDSLMPEVEDARRLYQIALQINNLVKERIVFE